MFRTPVALTLCLALSSSGALAETQSVPETDCDRLSGMPLDRDWLDLDVTGPVFTQGGGKGELEAIIAACQAAADQNPSERRFAFRLGLALKKAGRTDEALAAFETARRLGSVGGYDEAAILLIFGAFNEKDWSKQAPKVGMALLEEGIAKTGASVLAYSRALALFRGPKAVVDPERGLAELTRLADAGDTHALFELASYQWRKNVSPERDQEAFALMRKAIDLGSARAAYRLGDWMRGKDDEEMIRLYRLAAARGSDDAMNALGYCYEYGIGLPQIASLAAEHYEMAAKRGHLVAQANLGGLYTNALLLNPDYDKARHWLGIASERGSGAASMSLGMLYDWGRGVPVDLVRARELYERSAAQGDPGGMNNMGYLFEHGRGAEVDLPKAREWYEKAVEAGSADAANNLAEIYRFGRGVPVDMKKAFALSMKSAEAKNAKGVNNLALAYQRGEGVAKDLVTARALLAQAEELGSAEAAHNLASMYEGGQGGDSDLDEARRLFRKAAQAGLPNAMYRYGNRVRLDADMVEEGAYRSAMIEARNWLKRAVEAGDTYGVRPLAQMFAEGEGGEPDPTEALRLYRIAAQIDPEARLELAGRLRTGDGVAADPAEARRIYGETSSPSAWTAYLEMLDRGEGGPKDPKAGADGLREKIAAGEAWPIALLARRMEEGAGTERDPAAARALLAEQLAKASPRADVAALLGRMREEGRGGPVDPQGAIAAYRQALDGSEPEAMARLAAMLRKRGGASDRIEARRLLERAGPRGGGVGFTNLFEMLDRGEGGRADPPRAALWLESALVLRRTPEALDLAQNPGKRVGRATRRAFLKLMEQAGYASPKGAESSGPLVSAETLAKLADRSRDEVEEPMFLEPRL